MSQEDNIRLFCKLFDEGEIFLCFGTGLMYVGNFVGVVDLNDFRPLFSDSGCEVIKTYMMNGKKFSDRHMELITKLATICKIKFPPKP